MYVMGSRFQPKNGDLRLKKMRVDQLVAEGPSHETSIRSDLHTTFVD